MSICEDGVQRGPADSSLLNAIESLESAVSAGRMSKGTAEQAIQSLKSVMVEPLDEEVPEATGRREQILKVVAKHFSQRGFHGTKLQLIADEVGVTRPSFYYYFKNKQEILEALTEEGMSRTEEMVDRVMLLNQAPREKLRTFITEYIKTNTQDSNAPVIFRTFHELSEEARERFTERRRVINQRLLTLIREGVYEGAFRTRDPQIALFAIVGSVNWMGNWYRSSGELEVDEIAEIIADLFLRGLEVEK
jgi:AcrR family transcriptional regulator